MSKKNVSRPHLKGLVSLVAVLAMLVAGYVGMQLAPTIHATASSVSQRTQLADMCPSAAYHC